MTPPHGGQTLEPVRLRVRTTEIDAPGSVLDVLPDADAFVWWQGGEGLVASGEALRVEPSAGEHRFEVAAARLRDVAETADVEDEVGLPGTGLVAFGSFTFDPERAGSVLVVPRTLIGRREGRTWMTSVEAGGDEDLSAGARPELRPPDRVRYAGATIDDVTWLASVAEAVERIEDGQVEKVVLARDQHVWDRAPFDARVLVRRLAEHFPGCFTFLCDGMIGATPELLVRRHGREVSSLVLAGSAPRDADVDEDVDIGRALLDSPKDLREHRYAVESVRAVLEPHCSLLDVDADPRLLQLENVQHLATHVTGELSADPVPTALELAGALHPTAAVGGTPRDAALDLIGELEPMDRGRYAAPVGWIDADGDGEWGIALRCAQLDGVRARLFAGAGIVAGSLPEAELDETRLKLRAMQTALEG